MKIYVGNLSYDVTENDLKQAFGEFGEVKSVSILKDKQTGKPKGFGFVEMTEVSEGQAAIKAMNGKEFMGRELKVDEAKERPVQTRGKVGYGDRGGERRFGGNANRGGNRNSGGNRGGGGRSRY